MKIQVDEIRPYTTTIKSGPRAGQQGTMYFITASDGTECSTWDDLSNVKQGDTIEGTIEVSDKVNQKTGQPYKNFKLPKRNLYQEVDELRERIEKLEIDERGDDSGKSETKLDDDISDEDIPF